MSHECETHLAVGVFGLKIDAFDDVDANDALLFVHRLNVLEYEVVVVARRVLWYRVDFEHALRQKERPVSQ